LKDANLIGGKTTTIDGTKTRARNSKRLISIKRKWTNTRITLMTKPMNTERNLNKMRRIEGPIATSLYEKPWLLCERLRLHSHPI
jgi:hypothetical protein